MNEPMATLSKLPPATWFLVAAAVVLGWGLSWLWRWYRRRRAQKALVAAVTASASDHVRDVLVPDGMGGYFHVDFILLTPRGILVIDLRDVRGNIFGGDQMTEWSAASFPRGCRSGRSWLIRCARNFRRPTRCCWRARSASICRGSA